MSAVVNKKKNIDWYLGEIDKLQKGNPNVKILGDYLNELSDSELANLAPKLASGEVVLPYYSPNLKSKSLDVTTLLQACDRLGIGVFQQIEMTDRTSGIRYITTHKYMILDLALRRQIQTVVKGKSVMEDNRHTDVFTGQASGPSAVVKITYPEMLILNSMAHRNSILELMGIRGGNEMGFKEAKRRILDNGKVTIAEIEALNTRATSTETVRSYLLAMHFDPTI